MRILFNGCSFFAGSALADSSTSLSAIVAEQGIDVKNIAISGSSNQTIFVNTMSELAKKHYDCVVVGFTSYPRYHFIPELDSPEGITITPNFQQDSAIHSVQKTTDRTLLESIKETILPRIEGLDPNEGWSISKKDFEIAQRVLLLVQHDWYSILEIIKYANIISKFSNRVLFVNTKCHWDNNFFDQFETAKIAKPENLTAYTNQLLNSDNRDDTQIQQLFDTMTKQYQAAGAIQKHLWVNLYNSWQVNKIDLATDNRHPGPQSHSWMASCILECL